MTAPHPKAPGSFLANYYNVSERTIDNWRRLQAPLSDPSAMPDWWVRTFPNRSVNRGILQVLAGVEVARAKENQRKAGGALPLILAEAVETREEIAQPAGVSHEQKTVVPLREIKETEIGFDQAHRRMLELEAELFARMKAAKEAGELGQVDLLRQDYLKLVAILGTADTKQIRNAIQRRELLHRGLIEREYATLVAHQPEVLRNGIKAFQHKLNPPPDPKIWDAAVDGLVDELFRIMPVLLLESIREQAPAA
jgi:hypothetical protein